MLSGAHFVLYTNPSAGLVVPECFIEASNVFFLHQLEIFLSTGTPLPLSMSFDLVNLEDCLLRLYPCLNSSQARDIDMRGPATIFMAALITVHGTLFLSNL
jgi:hypothetical protein